MYYLVTKENGKEIETTKFNQHFYELNRAERHADKIIDRYEENGHKVQVDIMYIEKYSEDASEIIIETVG